MLGKQGWQLMTSPDTLCSRVLKGKYFPNGDFVSAKNKRNSSHTWQAILAGRKALDCGLIRRIGDGETTNIWRDRWIPGTIGGRPICPKPGALVTRVSELLTVHGLSWDDQALNDNLLPIDAQAVRRIPLGRRQGDFWAWSGERHGLYTVHSAYRLLVEQEAHDRYHKESRAASSLAINDPYWQKLWKCKVPPKVRVFWWRVSHDYMPCRANLYRKHIEPIGTYVFCGMEDETTYHALTQCSYAAEFWNKFRTITGIKLPKLNPRTWTRT
jgi:hypothetical protein